MDFWASDAGTERARLQVRLSANRARRFLALETDADGENRDTAVGDGLEISDAESDTLTSDEEDSADERGLGAPMVLELNEDTASQEAEIISDQVRTLFRFNSPYIILVIDIMVKWVDQNDRLHR